MSDIEIRLDGFITELGTRHDQLANQVKEMEKAHIQLLKQLLEISQLLTRLSINTKKLENRVKALENQQ